MVYYRFEPQGFCFFRRIKTKGGGESPSYTPTIPNYPQDLNATAAAKRQLLVTPELQQRFKTELLNVFARKESGFRDSAQVIVLKTASDETHALLRTIGKWKD